MMKKRLLLCALLLCILLTACSTAAETEPVSISFMHGWGGSGADHVGMRELFAAFEEENPDIHIVYDTSPDLEIVMERRQTCSRSTKRRASSAPTATYSMFQMPKRKAWRWI